MKTQSFFNQFQLSQIRDTRSLNSLRKTIKIALALSILFVLSDFIYKTVEDIDYLTRSKCIINKFLPKIGFLFFEYFIELTIVVFISIFAANLLNKYFLKFKRFFPTNPVTAFIYASILPVCSCAAIPIVKTMQEKGTLQTVFLEVGMALMAEDAQKASSVMEALGQEGISASDLQETLRTGMANYSYALTAFARGDLSTASALALLVMNLIGLGLGPTVVGILNDALEPSFGQLAVRYSLLIVAVVSLWGGLHNYLAARALPRDLRATEHALERD